jgi:hypothetical protein
MAYGCRETAYKLKRAKVDAVLELVVEFKRLLQL